MHKLANQKRKAWILNPLNKPNNPNLETILAEEPPQTQHQI